MAAFLDGADKSLDLAIYDLRLDDEPANRLLTSFNAAVKRGVQIRLLFNQDPRQAIPGPPPPAIDWAFIDRLKELGIPFKPVPGVPDEPGGGTGGPVWVPRGGLPPRGSGVCRGV